jgi:HK97 family phage portal protein
MKFMGFEFGRSKSVQVTEQKSQFEDVLSRLIAARDGTISSVTAETCMASPTVHAIVTAVSRRIAVSAVHVYQKTQSNGRDAKKPLPSHPVAKLLQRPNEWQSRVNYWQDATSTLVRHGNYFSYKSRGSTGPIRALIPLLNRRMTVEQNDDYSLKYLADGAGGRKEIPPSKMHHVRSAARNFYLGDSPVDDVKIAIALEIAAEKFGATFFQNGALPLLVFSFLQGSNGFKNPEESKQFVTDFQEALGGGNKFKAMLLPKGIDKPHSINVENDKAQFLETRKYQRTVIAGAFGVPPHLVGDLERATFNNVEQQDSDFTLNVVMPYAQIFEAAMERDLLTDDDRASGVIIRFNLDSILRADFKSRQEGLRIQHQEGVISANEWREIESMNPITDADGGDDYWRPANMGVAGADPIEPPNPIDQLDDSLEKFRKAVEAFQ